MSALHRQLNRRRRRPRRGRFGGAPRLRPGGSVRRLFTVYAAVSLMPVLVLGAVLTQLLNAQADARGLAEGRAEANIIARVALAPLLSGRDLRSGLQTSERLALTRTVTQAIRDGDLLRLRLRDLDGRVVFSDDGSGGGPDEESLEAAQGETVSEMNYLNADANDNGPRGPRAVEVYEPLNSGSSGARIAVLEVYVPYAPIAAEIAHGQRTIVATLSGGLLVLWLGLLFVSASVTGRLRRQAAVNAYLASHDTLTAMPNRVQFLELAELALADATPPARTAIALIDLDRFKEVNDTLGPANGDRLLIMMADRLKEQMRPGDTVARLGGDEFGVVLCGLRSAAEAAEIVARLRARLGAPVQVDGLPLSVEASVGFAIAPNDGTDVDLLLQRADVAMSVAKREHLGTAHYLAAYDVFDSSTLTLVAELGGAIANDELVLHYQPKADLRSGRITAVEALVRWQHPSRGLLYPDAFVPAAEQTELIDPLTRWVLRTAAATLPALDPTGQLNVAINISARNVSQAAFADDVLDVLADANIDPRRIILELTETALLTNPARAAHTLARLHEAGIRISIDDFGAGQTSLSYLVALPITELKIDKGFVLSMLADARNAAIVRSVIELGHSLGFTVTAEGVETIEALEQLTRYGCDTAQGYVLARPMSAADLNSRRHEAMDVLAANTERVTPARSS